MQVIFLGKFSRDLDDLTDADLKASAREVIRAIELAPTLSQVSGVKKMKGFKNAFRIRVRDYRIGLYYENGIAELARFLDRKKIYKVWP
ncbi:MAG TPA: plasmid stabilization protein [Candidatus Kapabacteria bacterium]|nr:plasmid stabilization protein [Candidatus Kapabacteria bacterium]